jgi:uncharacterized membrane protein
LPLSPIGVAHTAAASLGLVTGAVQLLRPRRDALHRRVGYVFVTVMAVSNFSALIIYKFTGGFNLFHALAIYNLLSVALAIRPMVRTPRPYQWRRIHYQWVAWSYAGLCAAAATEFLVRVILLPGWLGALVGTPPVILLATWMIRRFAPPLRPPLAMAGS